MYTIVTLMRKYDKAGVPEYIFMHPDISLGVQIIII